MATLTNRTETGALSRRATDLVRLLERTGASCEVVFPDGEVVRRGEVPARLRVTFRSERALACGLNELALGRAYVEEDLEIEGDMLALFVMREGLQDRAPLSARLDFLRQLFLCSPTRVNHKAIGYHYTLGDDFYLGFIDRRYRFYSQVIFRSEDEGLEEAAEHKLEQMWEALDLKPGMRLLDIGGGWGGVAEYCGSRGVHVTSLTIVDDSYRYISNLIRERNLPCEVILQDFLEHRPEKPYDAVVIYGVIEHIPNYRRFCARAWECLPPGGKLYLDASASKEKFLVSAFTRRYTWHGTHTFLGLAEMVQEWLYHGFEVLEVKNETHDYELTMRHWAERFDARRAEVVARWGEATYRAHRIFLWGGCHAFRVDRLQAYRLVVRRGHGPGPRPGLLRRARTFVWGLR